MPAHCPLMIKSRGAKLVTSYQKRLEAIIDEKVELRSLNTCKLQHDNVKDEASEYFLNELYTLVVYFLFKSNKNNSSCSQG